MNKRRVPRDFRQPEAKKARINSRLIEEFNALISENNSLPPIQDTDYYPTFEEIIAPLRDKEKLILQKNNDKIYDKFIQKGELSAFPELTGYDDPRIHMNRTDVKNQLRSYNNWPRSVERQMGQFLANQLSTLNDTNKYMTADESFKKRRSLPFHGLHLRKTKEYEDDPKNPGKQRPIGNNYRHMDRIATVNFAYNDYNPLSIMNHESNHALDYLYMHNQTAGIKNLIKFMKNKGYDPRNAEDSERFINEESSWYNEAQDILPSDQFSALYSYDDYGKPGLLESLKRIAPQRENRHHRHFGTAKDILKVPKFAHENIFAKPFTEFTTHSMQYLHKPWRIDESDWLYQNQGRKLLSSLTKNIHKKYQELDPNFRTNYPDLNQAFLDRITQVRNYKKHSDADRYIQDYIQKYNSRYNQLSNPYDNPSKPSYDTNVGTPLTTYGTQNNDPTMPHPVSNSHYQDNTGYHSSPTGTPEMQLQSEF